MNNDYITDKFLIAPIKNNETKIIKGEKENRYKVFIIGDPTAHHCLRIELRKDTDIN